MPAGHYCLDFGVCGVVTAFSSEKLMWKDPEFEQSISPAWWILHQILSMI
jgi:hypothetical protein